MLETSPAEGSAVSSHFRGGKGFILRSGGRCGTLFRVPLQDVAFAGRAVADNDIRCTTSLAFNGLGAFLVRMPLFLSAEELRSRPENTVALARIWTR